MLKDRGNKKWTSLMLVEHKRQLRKLQKKQNDRDKPKLEEHKLQEMNYLLEEAINNNQKISVKYYHNNDFSYYRGKIKEVNKNNILLKNNQNNYKLKIGNIIDINIVHK